ncbi:MAG: 23S rRNA (uracil(1939)-C(5))-methyltransferase RlmD [Bacteroidetes bacterium]|nr:MAG: 23S rRNA (uracil(1939)-C(5))-methyltransferase RlmD [Bacteroidota bacterium]
MSRRRSYPLLEKVEILDAGSEGKAVARHESRVVFVPWAAPGDVVDIQVTKKKKQFYEGKVVKYHTYSPLRIEPFCAHYGLCGGCKWQHLGYEDQLTFKQKQVFDNFSRIGKFDFPELSPIVPSEKTQYYRNKLEFTFSDFKWMTGDKFSNQDENERNLNGLGFHLPGLFDRIVDIDHCYLQPEPSNLIRNEVRDFAMKEKISFYNAKRQEGYLRNLIVRNASTGDLMVILVVKEDQPSWLNRIMNHLKERFPEITALLYVINGKKNDDISDQEVVCFAGKSYMMEEMEGLSFKVGPKSFYQTNRDQAYELYKIAREFASLTGEELVYDLYTGTGTIANFVAGKAKRVVGIEYVASAIEDAKENSAINGISNTRFFAGDMAKVLNREFVALHGRPDVVITDPPRAGMHEKVVNQLLEARPQRIVYVSCNPATQARDITLLSTSYQVDRVQPVDMFPHTHHVENVALLSLKEGVGE